MFRRPRSSINQAPADDRGFAISAANRNPKCTWELSDTASQRRREPNDIGNWEGHDFSRAATIPQNKTCHFDPDRRKGEESAVPPPTPPQPLSRVGTDAFVRPAKRSERSPKRSTPAVQGSLPSRAVLAFERTTPDNVPTHRRENITDWALEQFRSHYADPSITKWDIFHYVYAVLHHPDYRQRYAANLRRELPRIPFASVSSVPSVVKEPEVFSSLAKAGQRLAEIHVHYEKQPEYKLAKVEKAGEKLDYRVTKMKLSKDKTSLIYNRFLTLSGIPPETYEYHLGNRSALEWIIDQYQVSTDKRSGITNDPNREERSNLHPPPDRPSHYGQP